MKNNAKCKVLFQFKITNSPLFIYCVTVKYLRQLGQTKAVIIGFGHIEKRPPASDGLILLSKTLQQADQQVKNASEYVT